MNWKLVFLPEAEKDFKCLSGNERIFVAKALNKVLENPLPTNEGGYGKPLGNKQGNNLSGFLKIKLKNLGTREETTVSLAELDNVNTTAFEG